MQDGITAIKWWAFGLSYNSQCWGLEAHDSRFYSVSEIGTCKSKVPWEVQGAPPASREKSSFCEKFCPNLASKIKEEDEARAEAAPEVAAKGCVWNRTRESQNMQKPGEAEIKGSLIKSHYSLFTRGKSASEPWWQQLVPFLQKLWRHPAWRSPPLRCVAHVQKLSSCLMLRMLRLSRSLKRFINGCANFA